MAEIGDDVPLADRIRGKTVHQRGARESVESNSSTSSGSSEQDGEDGGTYMDNSPWVFMPEPLFIKIFLQLRARDVLNAGQCCKRWYKLSKDDYIWRKYFRQEFNVDPSIQLKRGERWYGKGRMTSIRRVVRIMDRVTERKKKNKTFYVAHLTCWVGDIMHKPNVVLKLRSKV